MYYLFRLGKIIVVLLPVKLSYLLASFLARIKFFLSKKDRRNLVFNLFPVLKDQAKARECACRITENFGFYLVDFFRFSKIDSYFIRRHVTFYNLDILERLVSQKAKIIILTAHIGNYELGAALMNILGYKLYAVALPHNDRRTNNFFNHQRKLCGVEVIPTGAGIKRCFRVLSENKIFALLGDRNFSGKGKRVQMFGKTCTLPRGAAMFASKTGAYILPSFFIRENTRFYRFIFDAPILPYAGERKKEEDEIIDECAKVLEKYISKYPTQWYMFEKYWMG